MSQKQSMASKSKFYGRDIHIWMQLPGFDRDKPDCGASEYLERVGFIPGSINALLFHSDIVHLHRGMASEYGLSPANCSYYASPRNTERERQPWTNYNLRTLARELKKAGSGLYAGIMGVMMNNAHHKEWIYDHREIMTEHESGSSGIHPLKRFRDGTWYEDFFVEKLCEMLTDYEMDGVQMADGYCPSGQPHHSDLSVDIFEQFVARTGIEVPDFVNRALRSNSPDAKRVRRDWIWRYHRESYLRFYAWRWERFFQKVCDRVHAIGKKVIVLGMYCTDPFETAYCLGFDLKSVVRAGVDYIMPNLLPTSVYMSWPLWNVPRLPYYFHRYMSIAPLTAAYVPDGHFLSMLNVHDTTEEYDVLHHAPCKFERDLHTLLMYQLAGEKGLRPCMEGLMLCLGDGLSKHDWEWMTERFSIASSLQPTRAAGATLLWSDHGHDRMMDAYIQTRRWTVHKFVYEMFSRGVPCEAVIRSEHCAGAELSGPLFVPNVDLCSDEEIRDLAACQNTIVCTAPVDFKPEQYGIAPDHVWTDPHGGRYPMQVFVQGTAFQKSFLDHLDGLLEKDDASHAVDELEGNPEAYVEEFTYTLYGTLAFARVSKGFAEQCAALLRKLSEDASGIVTNVPTAAFETSDGKYRLYLYGKNDDIYDKALVHTTRKIKQVDIITKYPVLPARMRDENHAFTVNVPPGGVTIVDIAFESPS